MSKEEKTTINVNVNIDSIRSAMKNAETPQDAVLEVPIINPRDLRLDDKIFNVSLKPITYKPGTKQPKEPRTVKYPAINAIVVNALSRGVKENTITVNGSIDLPENTGRSAKIEEIYVANEAGARAIARVYAEVQLDLVTEIEERIAQEKEFLMKQVDDDRY